MTQQEEEYLRSLASPQHPGEVDLPGRVQAVIDRLGNIDGLEKKAVMLEMQANGQNPLPSYLGLGQGQSQVAPPASPMAGWADATEQGGLGLASRQMEPQAMNRPTLADALAAQTFPGVDLSYFQKNRLVNAALEPEMLAKRASLAQTIQAQEETARQHDLQLFEKAMASPRAPMMMEQLGNTPNYRLAKQAKMFSKAMKEQDYDSLAAYREFIPDEVQQRFMEGKLPYHELTSWLDQARTAAKTNAQKQAESMILQRAQNKPADQRSPYEAQLVEEHEAKTSVQRADAELKEVRAANEWLNYGKGGDGGDNGNLNKIHKMVSDGLDWDAGNKETREKALQRYATLIPQARTDVQMATPADAKERGEVVHRGELLKSGRMVPPPRGTSKGELRTGDYVEMNRKQKEEWGEIENSGMTLGTMFEMVDPLITAQTSGQAMKQYAKLSLGAVSKKNPAAATYLADSEAFSSRMARVFGSEVGVLTQGDVDRWKRALPTFGDTVAVKDAKKKVFMDIYNQSRQMYIKRIAGEDITDDLNKLRKGPLAQIDKVAPTTVDEDFDLLMGGKK